MIKRTETGEFIISASEVGAFVMCPKSWELRNQRRGDAPQCGNSAKGEALHAEWAKQFEAAVKLGTEARLLAFVILLLVGVYFLMGLL